MAATVRGGDPAYGILSVAMSTFDFVSADGTRVVGWRNEPVDAQGPPILICNGLGTPPTAWPTVVRDDGGFRVVTWYYRGTGGGERPADPERIGIDDHVADAIALLDDQGIDCAVVASWSLGVNVAFELARQHPDRVAGLMAVAGVPGGTFRAMFGVLGVPRRLRHRIGLTAAKLGRSIGPQLSWVAEHIPLNRTTATVINHSGFILPAARPDRLIPALDEFRRHDFRWYFTLAVGAAAHEPMDLEFVKVPVTLVAGRYDVLTSANDMIEAAEQIPQSSLCQLPGSHFLPLEFPDELAAQLRKLADRTAQR
jgi:pimeloyl-ACP methyl ester carboxylesterase